MKQFYICLLLLATVAGTAQEKEIPDVLTLAVKESQGWNVYQQSISSTGFYARGYRTGLMSQYTSDILDRRANMVYVDGDKLYSNNYVPIVLQQHQTNLATDNFYRYEKMYALPDSAPNRQVKQ